MDADAEREMIEQVQAGDQLAAHLLFKLYRPRIFRIVNYILRDSADSEDVVQDIFLKLFTALEHFRHDASFFTWIYKIAVNAARARLTAKSRDANVMTDSGTDMLEQSFSSSADQPEVLHQRAELARMLDLAITALPANWREAFLLREIDGLSYADIAELMHCPVGTVRSRISRAKAFLAERLSAPHES
jgi:RNA polymerase sigma-70 factor (ECF subfamily)